MGMYDKSTASYSFPRPIKSVALDPEYGKKQQRPLVAGGLEGKLHYITKGRFFQQIKVDTLHANDGKIHAIKWRRELIAWANDAGVKIYDTVAEQRIVRIDPPEKSPRPDMFRCNLCWENDNTLIVAWGNWVRLCTIKERPQYERVAEPTLPARCGEITFRFETDFCISGVAPYGGNLLVLAYDEDISAPDQLLTPQQKHAKRFTKAQAKNQTAPRPELRNMQRNGEDISSDALNIRGFEGFKAVDYRLEHNEQTVENIFYILSPQEIIIARPCDNDDHVAWLLKHKKYQDALQFVRANPVHNKEHSVLNVGERFLTHLVEGGGYAKAASHFSEILTTNAELWEKWIFLFAAQGHLQEVVEYIPTTQSNFILSATIYDLVLNYLLKKDPAAFLREIRRWNPSLYDIPAIIEALKSRLAELPEPKDAKPDVPEEQLTDPHILLSVALARLYEYRCQFALALKLYLHLRRSDVFDFIERHSLFDAVHDKVPALIEMNPKRGLDLLVSHHDSIAIDHVVTQLKDRRRYLHQYLDALFKYDTKLGKEYHNLQVELYAEFEPQHLLQFLRTSQDINLPHALKVCKERSLIEEMVYIMGRTGSKAEGLELIIEKFRSVKKAINFIQEHDPNNLDNLFENLVDTCIKDPSLIGELLSQLGQTESVISTIDPYTLINKIPPGMEIEGLRDKLVAIIHENTLTKWLKDGCLAVLKKDVVTLEQNVYAERKRALKVRPDAARCIICNDPLRPVFLQGNGTQQGFAFDRSADRGNGVLMFFCHHGYHVECYRDVLLSSTLEPGTEAPVVGFKRAEVIDFIRQNKGRCLQCHPIKQKKAKEQDRERKKRVK
eukprot:TRINITY_DN306_c1_g2_i1.p1 TRINITY_DN306_c1_g2~~TRINITY_DN306_c1_g2_i1.p1  ORF type:complete len:938 (-),score=231.64 TRINITY_DN306_c1_g2_i1:71-2587(-)